METLDDKTAKKLKRMMAVFDDDTMTRAEFLSAYEQVVKMLMTMKQQNMNEIEGLRSGFEKIKTLLKDGNSTDFRNLKSEVKTDIGMLSAKLDQKSKQIDEKMAQLRDGIDGVSPDPAEVAKQAAELIKLPEYRAPIMDGGEEIRNKLEILQGEERLDKSAVKGIEKIEDDIKEISLRPAGRGGGAKGFMLFVDGSRKGLTAQHLNLIAGTGITLSYAFANGRNDVTITATGTASLTPITVTGTIDNSNTSFTAASAPSLVVINGASYRDGKGVTIVGTAITTDAPVGNGGDIYAL